MRSDESMKAELIGRAFEPTAKLLEDLKGIGVNLDENPEAARMLGEWAAEIASSILDMVQEMVGKR